MKKIQEGLRGDSLEVESGGVIIVKDGGALDLREGARIQSAESIILSKAASKGFKVDPESPSFGWHDIIGTVEELRSHLLPEDQFTIYGLGAQIQAAVI